MVTKPTVLVVGAGASIPYGYPSGTALVKNILDGLGSPVQKLFVLLEAFGFERREIGGFRDELRASQLYSVDAFLERRSQYMKIGKTVIAASLIPFEDNSAILTVGDWYQYLHNVLVNNLERGARASLTIVTYNYDRSLDHYLYNSLAHTYGHSPEKMCEVMKQLNIVHIHGSLCGLPWQEHSGFPRAYGVDKEHTHIRHAANQIKIIHENNHDTLEYKTARAALLSAEIICFLGFGYQMTNLNRLLHGGWHLSPLAMLPPIKRTVTGTVYGMTIKGKRTTLTW